jgi:hypothetical protein
MAQCIYCKAKNATSLSHIIPESLGNNVNLKTGVCDECNSVFNQEVEEPIVKALIPIRSFFQLIGKRGELPRLRVEVRYGSGRQYVDVKSLSELLSRVFVFTNFTDPGGVSRNITFISFDRDEVEQHRRRYAARHAEAPISEIPQENLAGLEFWVNFDFGLFADPRCLRMIAKIAFEWWCRERSPEFVASEEYDEIRNYIRYGVEPAQPIVSVIDDEVVGGYFRNIPFGGHLLYRRVHPRLGSMVMVVAPYSLVYYKVILTRQFRALASNWVLTFVNPQTGDPYSPSIINPRGTVLTVSDAVPPNCMNAVEVIGRLTPALLDRLNEGMRVILEQNRNRLGTEVAGSAD